MGTYKAKKNNLEDEDIEPKSEKEKTQESTEKAVNLAGEIALDYFTGGKGSQIKNIAEKVPIAGSAVKNTWDKAVKGVSKVVSGTPIGNVAKIADDSGVTDTLKNAKDVMNNSGGTLKSNLDSGLTSKKKDDKTSSSKSALSSLFSSNDSSALSGNIIPKFVIKKEWFISIFAGALLCLMLFVTVFAEQDEINLEITNDTETTSEVTETTSEITETTSEITETTSKVIETTSKVIETTSKVTQTTSKVDTNDSEKVIASLEKLANYFIENAGEYNSNSSLDVSFVGRKVRKDCSGFATAYMHMVSGNVPESSTDVMSDINSSWANSIKENGWVGYTVAQIGSVSNLKPGDVLVQKRNNGKSGHAEIYVDSTHTFGWGSKQSKYPLNKTIVDTSSGSKKTFGDGYHSSYTVVYRYEG